MMREVMLDSLD